MSSLSWSDVGSAAVGAGFGALSDSISNIFGASSAKRQFKNQKELMRLQNQYNVENWNRENAYNTPSEQRKRLASAGVNPDLFYQNGASGVTAQQISGASLGSASSAPIVSGGMLQGASLASQIELNKSLANQANANASKTNAEIPWIDRFNQASVDNLVSQTGLNNAQVNQISENIKLMGQDYTLKDCQIEIQRAQASVAGDYYYYLTKDIQERYNIDEQNAKIVAKYGMRVMEAQLQLDYASAYNQYHQGDASVMNANANLKNSDTSRMQYELDKAIQDGNTALSKLNLGSQRIDNNVKLRMTKVAEDTKDSQIFSNYVGSVSQGVSNIVGSYSDYKMSKPKYTNTRTVTRNGRHTTVVDTYGRTSH